MNLRLDLSRLLGLAFLLVAGWTLSPVAAQEAAPDKQEADKKSSEDDKSLLNLQRIYGSGEFGSRGVSARWVEDGYTSIERSEIVLHDHQTGEKRVLVKSQELVPPGQSSPLSIQSYAWSPNRNLVLIYTNSKRVWRANTRGDYWLLDRSARQLRKLGGEDAPASSMMFAKLSPDASQLAFVRHKRIYVEDLLSHEIRCMTPTDDEHLINGTSDWVHEEEFFLRDGFRWSPDGKKIAYWQFDTRNVPEFPLVNNTDSLYPTVEWFAYPKVGQRNATSRIGVVDCKSGETTWLSLPGPQDDIYLPRIKWVSPQKLLIQKMNRLQNTNHLILVDVTSGDAQVVLTEKDQAWVDVHDEMFFFEDGRRFTWISERDGWRHAYLGDLESGELKLLTSLQADVIQLLHVDEAGARIYFIASPDSPTQRYLYQVDLNRLETKRVTPDSTPGTHSYQISKDGKFALHRFSSSNHVPTTELVSLPDHETVRMVEENEKLAEKLKTLKRTETEFFRVDIGDGIELDGWCIKPPDLDENGKYPLLLYVYGEPAGSTVTDRWGGSSYLWHLMLAQRGYVVMSFDNRGTNVPRGRDWRKCIYRKIGILGPQDQAAALKAVLKQRPYLDPSRVGIWGWSGGGSSSLQAIFKHPDLYHAAIAVAPVPNQRYYDTIYQERYMGLPDQNGDGYQEGSAINFAHQLEGELLLIHGTADDNCHYQTTEMLVDALISHNKQFSLMVYPNRTHSIRERKNTTRHLRELMTRFLEDRLPAKVAAESAE